MKLICSYEMDNNMDNGFPIQKGKTIIAIYEDRC